MFTAIKIESTVEPKKFESLNNGIWYYNYDIVKKIVKTTSMEGEIIEETRYYYVQTRINGEPTLSKCYEAVLKVYKDENGSSLYDILLTEGSNTQIEDINYNIKVDFDMASEKSPLEKAKEDVIRAIDQYDTSSNVNSFTLNGVQVWLPRETRVSLMNSITIEKNSGKEESTMWFNDICVTVNCDAAIQMLSALELYALTCYNKTAEHKLNINQLTTVADVISYDYTTGYPDKLVFII